MTLRANPPGQQPHTWGVMHFGNPDGRKLSIAGAVCTIRASPNLLP